MFANSVIEYSKYMSAKEKEYKSICAVKSKLNTHPKLYSLHQELQEKNKAWETTMKGFAALYNEPKQFNKNIKNELLKVYLEERDNNIEKRYKNFLYLFVSILTLPFFIDKP